MSPFTFVPAYTLPVYASQCPLPDTTQDSVRGCRLSFTAVAISDDMVSCAFKAQPARIRTSPIRASGSYLGCLTAKRFAACRTRLSAWVTHIRLWVRCVLCWSAFPLAPALRSTASATDNPALFGGFTATMAESDFSESCIGGYGSRLPTADRQPSRAFGRSGDLPVPLTRRLAGSHHRLAERANSLGVARDLLCLEHLNRTCAPAGWPQRMPSRKSRL